jgi:signal transduction histidine kinase
MNSLRWRLITGILASITLVLAAGGSLAFARIKNQLYAQFDLDLLHRAVALKHSVEQDKGKLDVGRLDKGAQVLGHEPGIDFFHVYLKDGETLAASKEWSELPLPRFAGPLDKPKFRDAMLPPGRKGRSVGIEFYARVDLTKKEKAERLERGETLEPQGPLCQLVLAKVDTVVPMLSSIKQLLFGLWTGGSLLSGMLIWGVVRKSLQPLGQLQSRIGELRDTVAGQRINLRRPPAELQPVVNELNRLLERIEAALVRERNLTSNVAHELRTPVAGMLSTLEVTLSRLRSGEEYRESTAECLEIAKRMNWLINNLLSITRIEAGNVQLHRQTVKIERALSEWWSPFAERAHDRCLEVTWEIAPGAKLQTDPEFLRVVMTNLFDNAVSYTPEGGAIHIKADLQANISVANNALGLNEAVVQRVFDPFWRNSESREQVGKHAGLGLDLCKKIVTLLGGRITAQIKEPEGMFEVRLEIA